MPELTHIDPETLIIVRGWGDFSSSVVLFTGHVVRAGKSLKGWLGLSSDQLHEAIADAGYRATQRRCPATVILELTDAQKIERAVMNG